MTIPIAIIAQVVSTLLQVIFTTVLPIADNSFFAVLYFVLLLALNIANAALMIPFWQSIKAVIYYDLRSRREGIGLQFKDRTK